MLYDVLAYNKTETDDSLMTGKEAKQKVSCDDILFDSYKQKKF